ncbi:MAG: glycosyltransferase [Bryobacteraceae bacterium]
MNEPVRQLPGWRIAAQRSVPGALNDCSLLVPTYCRAKEVVFLLEKVEALGDVPGEVVIVDSSPGRELEEAARNWAGDRRIPFDLVYVESPKGLTLQRNVGIDISTREFIFFLDDDAFPREGYFRHIHDVFAADAGGKIGAVGGCIINEIAKPISRRWQWRLRLGLVPQSVQPYQFHDCGSSVPSGLLQPFHGTRPVDVVQGGASAFRREVFREMRFSEFFYGYAYGEDVEMSLRVKSRWQVMFSGDARCEHHPAPGGRPASYAKGRMEVRNRYFIWKRHRPGASMANRFRFYGDLGYLFFWDMAWFAVRPWRLHFASHGLGVAAGALECLVNPPRYEEPAAKPMFALRPAGAIPEAAALAR